MMSMNLSNIAILIKVVMKFGDTEIIKQIFHQYKRPVSIKRYRY